MSKKLDKLVEKRKKATLHKIFYEKVMKSSPKVKGGLHELLPKGEER